jgi:glucans biosynthesis protein
LLDKDVAWVKQTIHTVGELTQANLIRRLDGTTAFLVDFEGPVLARLPAGTPVNPQVSVNGNAELLSTTLEPNPAIDGWRLTLRIKVKDPKQPVEMRAALVSGTKALSETWSYQLPPRQ